jgi:hypothetical protein
VKTAFLFQRNISAVDPTTYADRFVKFITGVLAKNPNVPLTTMAKKLAGSRKGSGDTKNGDSSAVIFPGYEDGSSADGSGGGGGGGESPELSSPSPSESDDADDDSQLNRVHALLGVPRDNLNTPRDINSSSLLSPSSSRGGETTMSLGTSIASPGSDLRAQMRSPSPDSDGGEAGGGGE